MSAPRKVPLLNCPECGAALIAPHARAYNDGDGNIVEHRDNCRCRWCDWFWFDDRDPVHCLCGASVGVEIDDGAAYAVVERPRAAAGMRTEVMSDRDGGGS